MHWNMRWCEQQGHVHTPMPPVLLLLTITCLAPVHKVAEQLSRQPVEHRHDGQRQLPAPVAGPIDKGGVLERLVVVEPLVHGGVLILIQLQLNGLYVCVYEGQRCM